MWGKKQSCRHWPLQAAQSTLVLHREPGSPQAEARPRGTCCLGRLWRDGGGQKPFHVSDLGVLGLPVSRRGRAGAGLRAGCGPMGHGQPLRTAAGRPSPPQSWRRLQSQCHFAPPACPSPKRGRHGAHCPGWARTPGGPGFKPSLPTHGSAAPAPCAMSWVSASCCTASMWPCRDHSVHLQNRNTEGSWIQALHRW